MNIVLHGAVAESFSHGLDRILPAGSTMRLLPDRLGTEAERAAFAAADAIIGVAFSAELPRPERLKLFQVPGAGFDKLDLGAIPAGAVVCNCYGHEQGIAEFVIGAMLRRVIPFEEGDRAVRRGEWPFRGPQSRSELAGQTLGLLGFGRIGKAIAQRARAFEMRVIAANRSPIETGLADAAYGLDRLGEFWPQADAIVASLPLNADTAGLVGAEAFAGMQPHAVLMNVGRGPVVDEAALFEALRDRRIGGAVIDTWYRYPAEDGASALPSALPFHTLDNVLMSPHVSGWTTGTVRRRQQVFAENIRRLAAGEPCLHVVRAARPE
jgi:phosphoglycerate dehydrogenase-like enzyme